MEKWQKGVAWGAGVWAYIMAIPVFCANSPDDWGAAMAIAGVLGFIVGVVVYKESEDA